MLMTSKRLQSSEVNYWQNLNGPEVNPTTKCCAIL